MQFAYTMQYINLYYYYRINLVVAVQCYLDYIRSVSVTRPY